VNTLNKWLETAGKGRYSSLESKDNFQSFATQYFVFWVMNKLEDRDLRMVVINTLRTGDANLRF